jgi:hypothetical protein
MMPRGEIRETCLNNGNLSNSRIHRWLPRYCIRTSARDKQNNFRFVNNINFLEALNN